MNKIIAYSAITIGLATALISSSITSDLAGVEGVGIIADNVDVTKVLSGFTVTTQKINCDEDVNGILVKNFCIDTKVDFQGSQVKVFVVGDTKKMAGVKFPFTNQLVGDNITDSEKRLIQMMEEQGINKYTIIK